MSLFFCGFWFFLLKKNNFLQFSNVLISMTFCQKHSRDSALEPSWCEVYNFFSKNILPQSPMFSDTIEEGYFLRMLDFAIFMEIACCLNGSRNHKELRKNKFFQVFEKYKAWAFKRTPSHPNWLKIHREPPLQTSPPKTKFSKSMEHELSNALPPILID